MTTVPRTKADVHSVPVRHTVTEGCGPGRRPSERTSQSRCPRSSSPGGQTPTGRPPHEAGRWARRTACRSKQGLTGPNGAEGGCPERPYWGRSQQGAPLGRWGTVKFRKGLERQASRGNGRQMSCWTWLGLETLLFVGSPSRTSIPKTQVRRCEVLSPRTRVGRGAQTPLGTAVLEEEEEEEARWTFHSIPCVFFTLHLCHLPPASVLCL
ncbi:uncharacterized protein LOC123823194 [Phyllostomus hastatus]|uniref:uncharacterized protein LOC123823194 n=1 Tax=Phyllostomus hastatus TaxID=9423 RepID=UPI001E682A5C|nr:uncharacterized protein LOC123823194 [Phyllostomus hastatus]